MFFSVLLIALLTFLMQFHLSLGVRECGRVGQPSQIRVAQWGIGAVTISWKTPGYPNGTDDSDPPLVMYSKNSNFLPNFTISGRSNNYDQLQNKAWFHTCVVPIENSITYYYRILPRSCVNGSDPLSFISQPIPGDAKSLKIGIVGDLGAPHRSNHASKTIQALIKTMDTTDLFLHVGDMSYADDHLSDESAKYEQSWDAFQDALSPLTSHKFYMTTPGNHEATCNQVYGAAACSKDITKQYRNFTAYSNRFTMPGLQSRGYGNMWYSFDYGLAHFVSITSETDFPNSPSGPTTIWAGGDFQPNGTQINWLAQDLARAKNNRRLVPWIIVFSHRPFFGSIPRLTSNDSKHNCEACENAFADIIFKNEVDFFFNGHIHWYERLFPVDRNGNYVAQSYINTPGPIFITSGAGGATYPETIQHPKPFNEDRANASANIISNYGFTQLVIKDSTNCEFQFFNSETSLPSDPVQVVRRRSLLNTVSHCNAPANTT